MNYVMEIVQLRFTNKNQPHKHLFNTYVTIYTVTYITNNDEIKNF